VLLLKMKNSVLYMILESGITIYYLTCRPDPKFKMFADSLFDQMCELKGELPRIKLCVIDFHVQYDPSRVEYFNSHGLEVKVMAPKPTVFQGLYRETKFDCFCASNTRNTGFVDCDTNYIVFVDDLSVLGPKWLKEVLRGYAEQSVLMGTYYKAKDLGYDGFINYVAITSTDSRRLALTGDERVSYDTSSLYGCSFAMPLIHALMVDGFDECCDGIGAEDYQFGIRLARTGVASYFCPDMLTVEDEHAHHTGENKKFMMSCVPVKSDRYIKGEDVGVMEDHAMLHWVQENKVIRPMQPTGLISLREDLRNGRPLAPSLLLDWRNDTPFRGFPFIIGFGSERLLKSLDSFGLFVGGNSPDFQNLWLKNGRVMDHESQWDINAMPNGRSVDLIMKDSNVEIIMELGYEGKSFGVPDHIFKNRSDLYEYLVSKYPQHIRDSR
jgi:hypothetical protein